ncbi:MAG: indolepyruvate ferredoxin oxidoreductase subunit alpha [Candidatus Glassbacteria bacterium]
MTVEIELLSGNEAIARGAYEAGIGFAVGYPGTPSTEILENIATYDEIRSQWAPNEKVALDVAAGASLGGMRVLVSSKHVGLNVASDTLMVLPYSELSGGLVIISADDPGMYSSQNEQDNRYLARFAKVPMLEPSDAQEAKDLVAVAMEISERFRTPVILRTTMRIAHTKCRVSLGERKEAQLNPLSLNPEDHVIPIYAKRRRPELEKRMAQLERFSDDLELNRIEEGNGDVGVITSGISYQYAKEVFPEESFLKLTMTNPLPRTRITEFAQRFGKVYVVEELEPFIEEQMRSWGIQHIQGKSSVPKMGELSPDALRKAFLAEAPLDRPAVDVPIPPRPPALCPGCPHTGVFYAIKKLKLKATGDIGCYTLGALPPLESLDTTFCMGASIGNAFGLEIARGYELSGKLVAVIGDSTFIHAGIPGLIDVVYNGGASTLIICDNRTTGMTGHQDHPGTGRNLKGKKAKEIDLARLVRALGIRLVRTVDPYDLSDIVAAIKDFISQNEPSVIISRRRCALLPEAREEEGPPYFVKDALCVACGLCLKLGCPAILDTGDNPLILEDYCVGCSLCAQVCPKEAIDVLEGSEKR